MTRVVVHNWFRTRDDDLHMSPAGFDTLSSVSQPVGAYDAGKIPSHLKNFGGNPVDPAKASMSRGELIATGRSLYQYVKRDNDARAWIREQGFSRAQEVFIMEGFLQSYMFKDADISGQLRWWKSHLAQLESDLPSFRRANNPGQLKAMESDIAKAKAEIKRLESATSDDIGGFVEQIREGIKSQVGDGYHVLSDSVVRAMSKSYLRDMLKKHEAELRRGQAEKHRDLIEASLANIEKINRELRRTDDGYKANFWTVTPAVYQNAQAAGQAITWKGLPARVLTIVKSVRNGMDGWEVFLEMGTRD
jgi:hypothetical protein